MSILVTGAAGYMESIVAQELIKEGNTVAALDNLEQGHWKRLEMGEGASTWIP